MTKLKGYIMKTINKNLKVTDKELQDLQYLFEKDITLVRKIKKYGAGHPQLPDIFGVSGTEAQRYEFWNEHETTHAYFIQYDCIEEIESDVDFTRYCLTFDRQEFDKSFLPVYFL